MKVFFVSDTHFDHKNIIAYTNRPFPDVETMNQKLIDRWNETVAEGDLVYFLGDFCMRPKQNARRFRSLLNGSIILIKEIMMERLRFTLKPDFLKFTRGLSLNIPNEMMLRFFLLIELSPIQEQI